MSSGVRLGLCFGFMLVLVACLCLASIRTIENTRAELTRINDVQSVKQRYAINFRGSVHDRAIAIRDVVLMTNPADRAEQIALIDELAQFYYESEARLDAMRLNPETSSTQDVEIDRRHRPCSRNGWAASMNSSSCKRAASSKPARA